MNAIDYTKEGIAEQCGFKNTQELTEFEASIQVRIAEEFTKYINTLDTTRQLSLWDDGGKLTEIIETCAEGSETFARIVCMQYAKQFFMILVNAQAAASQMQNSQEQKIDEKA